MNGAESLVRTLVAGGVDVCFTNPGTSEMHFVAALDRAGPAIAAALEIGAATEDIEKGTFLGLRMADNSQHRQRRKQKSKSTDHFLPREKITICSETGHNCRDFASNEPVTAPFPASDP